MADRITTTEEFTMFGLPATLVVELKTERGHTIRVPIGDQCDFISPQGRYSEIRVPIAGSILRRVNEARDDAARHGL